MGAFFGVLYIALIFSFLIWRLSQERQKREDAQNKDLIEKLEPAGFSDDNAEQIEPAVTSDEGCSFCNGRGMKTCPACRGASFKELVICRVCHGTGWLRTPSGGMGGTCSACGGTGHIGNRKRKVSCNSCGGSGVVTCVDCGGADPDNWLEGDAALDRFEAENEPEYFKEDSVDDWMVGGDEAKDKTIKLGIFFHWLLDEHPEDDEIFNHLKESDPEWDELSDDAFISGLMKDDLEGRGGLCSSDMEHILPSGCWHRFRELLVEFLQVSLDMVKILPGGTLTEREWNFREDNNQHFYGDIPYNQEIITLTLNWKPDSLSPSKLAGKYQLDLSLLLEKGFVQEGSKGIKLRFQSTGDAIEIAIDRNSPALRIGSKPEQKAKG